MNAEELQLAIKAMRYYFKDEQERLDSYTKEELYNHLYYFLFAYHETIRTGKPYVIPNYLAIADYFKVALNKGDD